MFEKCMYDNHFFVQPMTDEDLKNYCTEKGLHVSIYEFNAVSNLLKNACMAPECPFYMKQSNSLAQHLESYISKCPAFHKTTKNYATLPAEEILSKSLVGECLVKFPNISPESMIPESTKKKMAERKEYYIDIINRLKEFYQKL